MSFFNYKISSTYTRSLTVIFASSVFSAVVPGINNALSEVYELDGIVVEATRAHPSQDVRAKVENSYTESRTSTGVGGSEIQNINTVNTLDGLRFTAPGLINQPFAADRFGGGTKIRTFGDWGASTSIDGLPAIKFAGEEGGGYSNARIPSIAISQIDVLAGGRGVQYGNGSDGGVVRTTIKSGRGYNDHFAITTDFNSAGEGILQAEYADSSKYWDFYSAGRFFKGNYGDDDPANLDGQKIGGGVIKVGLNPSDNTRIELLGIYNQSDTDILRGGNINNIDSETNFFSATVDHAFSKNTSMKAGILHSDTNTQWPARNRDRATKITTAFADAFHIKQLSDSVKYSGSIGAEYKFTNTLRDNQWDNKFRDPAIKSLNSLTFYDNLVLTAGLRQTWFDNEIQYLDVTQPDNLKTDSIFSWNVGAAYSIFDQTRLRANVATGYNRFYEKYGNFGTDALNPVGAEDTIVESLTYEAGIRQSWSRGYIDAAVYYTEQDDVPRRNGGAIQSVHVAQSGLELKVFANITDRLTAQLGYAHIFDVKATLDDGTVTNGNIFFGSNGVPVPDDQVTLKLDYKVTDNFSVWGVGLYNKGFVRTNADDTSTKSRAFHRIDLGAAWKLSDNFSLRSKIENITDEKDFGQTLEGATVDTEGKLGRVFWFGMDVKL